MKTFDFTHRTKFARGPHTTRRPLVGKPCSMDYSTSTYLLMLKSTKHFLNKYLPKGHQHVGTNEAQTYGLALGSLALFR